MLSTKSDHKTTIWICGCQETSTIKYLKIEVPTTQPSNELMDVENSVADIQNIQSENIYEAQCGFDSSKVVAVKGLVYLIGGGYLDDDLFYSSKPYIQLLGEDRIEHLPEVLPEVALLVTSGKKRERIMELRMMNQVELPFQFSKRPTKTSCNRRNPIPFDEQHLPYNPEVAVLDEKIYIFGTDESGQPSSQVFDTVNETFIMVPDGFRLGHDLKSIGVDIYRKRIVFLEDASYYYRDPEECTFFFYNTVNMMWDREEEPKHSKGEPYLRSLLLKSAELGLCVFVGNMIYWLTLDKQMMAYDFDECEYYESKELTDLQGKFQTQRLRRRIMSAKLLHMNENYFCLVWHLSDNVDDNLYITKLRVSCNTVNKRLTVSVLDTCKYLIDGIAFPFWDALLLTEPLSMPETDDTVQDVEESAESTSVEALLTPYISKGNGFISDVPLSIWVYGNIGKELCWFAFDLSESEVIREVKRMRTSYDDEKEIKVLEPIQGDNCGILYSSQVAVDDIIYIIGGSYTNPWKTENGLKPVLKPCIQCFDTKTKKIVTTYSMVKGRAMAEVAEVEGKIYIFGGDDKIMTVEGSIQGSAEVFDPTTGCSNMLKDGYDLGHKLIGVDRGNKRIVFIKREHCPIRFYDTVLDEWTIETGTGLGGLMCHQITNTNCLIVDTTIYWFGRDGMGDEKFMSYDFVEHDLHLSDIVEDIKGFPMGWTWMPPYLFHIHDDLYCLAFIQDLETYHFPYNRRVGWMILRISDFDKSNIRFQVDVLHVDACLIPQGFKMSGALRVLSTKSHSTHTAKDAASS